VKGFHHTQNKDKIVLESHQIKDAPLIENQYYHMSLIFIGLLHIKVQTTSVASKGSGNRIGRVMSGLRETRRVQWENYFCG